MRFLGLGVSMYMLVFVSFFLTCYSVIHISQQWTVAVFPFASTQNFLNIKFFYRFISKTYAWNKNGKRQHSKQNRARNADFCAKHFISKSVHISSVSFLFSNHSVQQTNCTTWYTAEDCGHNSYYIPTFSLIVISLLK